MNPFTPSSSFQQSKTNPYNQQIYKNRQYTNLSSKLSLLSSMMNEKSQSEQSIVDDQELGYQHEGQNIQIEVEQKREQKINEIQDKVQQTETNIQIEEIQTTIKQDNKINEQEIVEESVQVRGNGIEEQLQGKQQDNQKQLSGRIGQEQKNVEKEEEQQLLKQEDVVVINNKQQVKEEQKYQQKQEQKIEEKIEEKQEQKIEQKLEQKIQYQQYFQQDPKQQTRMQYSSDPSLSNIQQPSTQFLLKQPNLNLDQQSQSSDFDQKSILSSTQKPLTSLQKSLINTILDTQSQQSSLRKNQSQLQSRLIYLQQSYLSIQQQNKYHTQTLENKMNIYLKRIINLKKILETKSNLINELIQMN